jgi:hypothetical protein
MGDHNSEPINVMQQKTGEKVWLHRAQIKEVKPLRLANLPACGCAHSCE